MMKVAARKVRSIHPPRHHKNRALPGFTLALLLLLTSFQLVAAQHSQSTAEGSEKWLVPSGNFILYGGTVLTMDESKPGAQAIWVVDGKIKAVGSNEEILAKRTLTTEIVDLEGATLLPGFVEPHLHIVVKASSSLLTDLSPCLPERYETRSDCPLYITEALDLLGANPQPAGLEWIIGTGLDPSRMALSKEEPAIEFHENPAKFIDKHVSSEKPVLIFDASGHLAYVNQQAFVTAGICPKKQDCGPANAHPSQPEQPGKWVVKDHKYTGLLQETQGFTQFAKSVGKTLDIQQGIKELIRLGVDLDHVEKQIASTGVTTIVNGGATTEGEALIIRLMAARRAKPLLRYRTLLHFELAKKRVSKEPNPVWSDANHGIYAATGIKLWADGSTQGCTASLQEPYNPDGPCKGAGKGKTNWTPDQIYENLLPFWEKNWYIQIHTNGDQAIHNALDALTRLQRHHVNTNPVTFLHFTVDGDSKERKKGHPQSTSSQELLQRIANLRAGLDTKRTEHDKKLLPIAPIDIHVSFLIGHVAYWGGAFQSILDGRAFPEHERSARLDAARATFEAGIPFSLHSDNPVTPVNPLWYVEQAVTRNTWFYPNLGEKDVKTMPGNQNITVEQALRAITIEPAIQHQLDGHIGSIKEGLVADLVILDKNPLAVNPNEIHKIKVLATYVNGFRHDH